MYFFKFNIDQFSNVEIKDGKVLKEDLEQLAFLDKSFDPNPWAHQTWIELPAHGHEAVFMFFQGLELLGLAVFRPSFEESLSHLLKFLIIPNRRREGLGELMLLKAIDVLKGLKLDTVYLEVEKGNPAFYLYCKIGLKKIHEIAHFYGPGRPALVMMLKA